MLASGRWPPAHANEITTILRRSAELDAMVLDLGVDPALGELDLLTVYLPGLDIAQHALLRSGDTSPLASSAMTERVRGIEEYYAFLDAALGRWLYAGPMANRQIVVVTQPGRVQQPSAGLMAVQGAGAGIGTSGGLSPTDVAPTILTALGVPTAGNLAGTPARSMFSEMFQAKYPARAVVTYGERRRPGQTRTGKPLDREMIERMRSLGYVR
jgi:hypothetical protein